MSFCKLYSQVGDGLLGMPVGYYLDYVNFYLKTHLDCSWNHSLEGVLGLHKTENELNIQPLLSSAWRLR